MLLQRRRPLITRLTAEKNRLGSAHRQVQADIRTTMAWWEQRLQARDNDLQGRLRASPTWREQDARLQSVPGIGSVTAVTLLAALPERGTWDRREISALEVRIGGGVAQCDTMPTAFAECLWLTMTTAIFDHLALAKPDPIVGAAPVGTIERFPVHFHAPRLRKHLITYQL